MVEIYHQVVIRSESETVYNAVTTQQALSRWWIADCTVKPEVGFVNEFRMEGYRVNKLKVVDLQPGRRVEWECQNDGPGDQWTGTHVSFEIRAKEDGCTLSFRHSNWRQATEFFATCSYHWARHLAILVELCATGRSALDRNKEREEVRKVVSD